MDWGLCKSRKKRKKRKERKRKRKKRLGALDFVSDYIVDWCHGATQQQKKENKLFVVRACQHNRRGESIPV